MSNEMKNFIIAIVLSVLIVFLALSNCNCVQNQKPVHQIVFNMKGMNNGEGIIEIRDPTEQLQAWFYTFLPEYKPRRQMEGKNKEFWTQWSPKAVKLLEPQILSFAPPEIEPIWLGPWSPEKWQDMLNKQLIKMLP